MRSEARFPALDRSAGHYESFYLKAAAPGGGRALWIRHTIHKRPDRDPTAAIWFTWFEAGRQPRAAKASFGAEGLSVPDGSYVRVDSAEVGPGRAVGSIVAGDVDASWELEFDDRHETLEHLPSDWMYRARLPRTKLLSPHPGAVFRGRLTLDGETIELAGWPGMVGHNWGTEHAERWIWLHGADFDGGEPGDYFDLAAGRIKLGRWTTPWVPNGMLVLGGEQLRLGGIGRTYGTDIDAAPGRCEFTVTGKDVTVKGTVEAPLESFVGWVYADPEGGEHNTVNCSVCDMRLRVERPGARHAHLTVEGAAAFELGMRESDHGVPIQPFGDG